MQSRISFKIASSVVRLAIRDLEKILESAKLNNSRYKSSTDGEVAVVSVVGVIGVTGAAWTVEGPSSAKHTLDGVDFLTVISVSSSDVDWDIM